MKGRGSNCRIKEKEIQRMGKGVKIN